MTIEMHEVTIRDLVEGFEDDEEEGVVGYKGKLNIRPKYQREFVYDDKQQKAVINTVTEGFPLNVMYWMKAEYGFELLDGQQRTMSICKYVQGDFSFKEKFFYNLTNTEKGHILNYKLSVYICDGNDKERLDWFQTINIAGEKLTQQEIRNAVYTGTWVTDAKKYFSKSNCVAYNLGKMYLTGSPIRQDYLETAIKWINDGKVEEYMALHQNDESAEELWFYFRSVIEWVERVFVTYRKEMKGIDWGTLYNAYKNESYSPATIENRVKTLMEDEEVTNKKGIYYYILTSEQRYLNLRAFSDKQKAEAYARCGGICKYCQNEGKNKNYKIEEMEADHIIPWSEGGKTTLENCQMLCKFHNASKSNH